MCIFIPSLIGPWVDSLIKTSNSLSHPMKEGYHGLYLIYLDCFPQTRSVYPIPWGNLRFTSQVNEPSLIYGLTQVLVAIGNAWCINKSNPKRHVRHLFACPKCARVRVHKAQDHLECARVMGRKAPLELHAVIYCQIVQCHRCVKVGHGAQGIGL